MQDIEVGNTGGGWFKPKDHMPHVAVVIEVKDFTPQRPTSYGPKDSAVVDIAVFKTEEELEKGEPSHIQKGCRIETGILARDLGELYGKHGAFRTITSIVEGKASKPGQHPPIVFRPIAAELKAQASAWVKDRDEAIAAAIEAAPSFD